MNAGSLPAPLRSTIGLIGLGLMGRALGDRLLTNPTPVLGYDIAPTAAAVFRAHGGTVASSAASVFASCEIVLLSLPTDAEVREVLQQAAGSLRPGQIIIDTTTGDPASTVRVGQNLLARQIHYLDATISGNSEQARLGQALWMVGGDRQAVAQCEFLFRILAEKVVHVGPCGTGARMKLVTNLVLGLNRAALAEGLVLAGGLGLDLKRALEVLQASMAYSRVMDIKGRKMIEADYSAQARLSQHLKDVRLILEAAAAAGLTLPFSETHRRLMEQAQAEGLGDQDNSAIIEVLRQGRGPGSA